MATSSFRLSDVLSVSRDGHPADNDANDRGNDDDFNVGKGFAFAALRHL